MTLSQQEILEILKEHKLWLESNGKEGKRANLKGLDLTGADLTGADLADANLSGANLVGANLIGTKLDETIFNNNPLKFNQMKWISIKDQLPEGDQTVLCWHPNRNSAMPLICYFDKEYKVFIPTFCDQEVHAVVTHWMKLPAKPIEKK